MPSKKKETKNEEKNFREFKFSGKVFEYTGRVYKKTEGKGKVISRAGVQLCLNGVFTLKGIHLVETEENYFLTFPQYKSGDDWKSYVYIPQDNKEFAQELDDLTDIISAECAKIEK